jgi:hypothetical protein
MGSAAVNAGLFSGHGDSLLKRMQSQSVEWRLHWLLRLGVFMEFVGHGCCGLNTKAGWLAYFKVFAIPESVAWRLMPMVGGMDIALGILALLAPRRALLLYMAIWGCFTALLRPAAGEGGWEFIERAYNYGIPMTFLLLHGWGRDRKSWFEALKSVPKLSPEHAQSLLLTGRIIVALMLIGHGGFGAFMGKKNLLGFYEVAGFGVFGLPLETIRAGIGFFEIALGVAALFASSTTFFSFIFAWKVGSELLYPISGASLACWEFVERGSSYVAPLVLLCLLANLRTVAAAQSAPVPLRPVP